MLHADGSRGHACCKAGCRASALRIERFAARSIRARMPLHPQLIVKCRHTAPSPGPAGGPQCGNLYGRHILLAPSFRVLLPSVRRRLGHLCRLCRAARAHQADRHDGTTSCVLRAPPRSCGRKRTILNVARPAIDGSTTAGTTNSTSCTGSTRRGSNGCGVPRAALRVF